ncbi:MAG: hypothetical protein R3E31_02885 [Chloroflexota bacterium]
MTDAAGNPVGDVVRYYPFGDYRTGSGPNEVTDRACTGQMRSASARFMYGHLIGNNVDARLIPTSCSPVNLPAWICRSTAVTQ